MRGTPDILPRHLAIVRAILERRLPPGARVWVFGSRASGTARKYSDLDLAIDAGVALEESLLLALGEDFEESDLPYGVDVVDWHAVDERFRGLIEAGRLPLPPGPTD